MRRLASAMASSSVAMDLKEDSSPVGLWPVEYALMGGLALLDVASMPGGGGGVLGRWSTGTGVTLTSPSLVVVTPTPLPSPAPRGGPTDPAWHDHDAAAITSATTASASAKPADATSLATASGVTGVARSSPSAAATCCRVSPDARPGATCEANTHQ